MAGQYATVNLYELEDIREPQAANQAQPPEVKRSEDLASECSGQDPVDDVPASTSGFAKYFTSIRDVLRLFKIFVCKNLFATVTIPVLVVALVVSLIHCHPHCEEIEVRTTAATVMPPHIHVDASISCLRTVEKTVGQILEPNDAHLDQVDYTTLVLRRECADLCFYGDLFKCSPDLESEIERLTPVPARNASIGNINVSFKEITRCNCTFVGFNAHGIYDARNNVN